MFSKPSYPDHRPGVYCPGSGIPNFEWDASRAMVGIGTAILVVRALGIAQAVFAPPA